MNYSLSVFSADTCFSSQLVLKCGLYYNVSDLYYVFMLAKGTIYEIEFAVYCYLVYRTFLFFSFVFNI